MQIDWLSALIDRTASTFGVLTVDVMAFAVVIVVGTICGAMGSIVVSCRMAFFSDALAHCAFAGIALGMLGLLAADALKASGYWVLPTVMVAFGVIVGVAIVYVRETTGLASDTVIGVFFAGAVGFGGMLYSSLGKKTNLSPEMFLFGSPLYVQETDLLALILLAVLLVLVLCCLFNHFVLSSINPSLARSRNVSVRLCNYSFIILLALIVNLSLRAVGALLINAMLVVPAATAANVSRNIRQMFWLSVVLSLASGLGGLWLSSVVRVQVGPGAPLEFGPAGTIVVVGVLLFFASVAWKAAAGRRSLASTALRADNAGIAPAPSTGRTA